jgi:hypothetical protein
VLGHRHVELVHLDPVAELARGSLREAERSPGSREHDVGAFLERRAGHAIGQRRVGQDTGDHDLLAVEQTHGGRR